MNHAFRLSQMATTLNNLKKKNCRKYYLLDHNDFPQSIYITKTIWTTTKTTVRSTFRISEFPKKRSSNQMINNFLNIQHSKIKSRKKSQKCSNLFEIRTLLQSRDSIAISIAAIKVSMRVTLCTSVVV